ncbi:MAG: hypothetical protein GY835_09585, partial [bacterium]|nr:hypothetical protein [bacterium]
LAGSAFKGLKFYSKLTGCERGVLVYGGAESYTRSGFQVRSWACCS